MTRCPFCKRAMPRPVPKKRAKPRRGPMRDAAYRRWCGWQLCALRHLDKASIDACNYWHHGSLKCDAAHTQNNGMRSKGPDSSCVPLCRKHHREFDSGRAAFEKKYGVDMKKLAAEHYERYLEEQTKA